MYGRVTEPPSCTVALKASTVFEKTACQLAMVNVANINSNNNNVYSDSKILSTSLPSSLVHVL